MPPPQSTVFFIRAAPLTFALLWSSGFIAAKYAVANADPFTFLVVRFAATIVILGSIRLPVVRPGRLARATPGTA